MNNLLTLKRNTQNVNVVHRPCIPINRSLNFFYNQLWFEATCYCMGIINFTLLPQIENAFFFIMLIVPWIVGKPQNSFK